MLSSTRTGKYLRLDEREVFLWNALDGDVTVRDLLFAYAERFGELALPRIEPRWRRSRAPGCCAACRGSGRRRRCPGRAGWGGRCTGRC
ncbi:hypothetical protein O1L60_34590 [Streptomyces diastatochromogenes]|nr:hypothetical protein [Streptomyces diastatochromogenes]